MTGPTVLPSQLFPPRAGGFLRVGGGVWRAMPGLVVLAVIAAGVCLVTARGASGAQAKPGSSKVDGRATAHRTPIRYYNAAPRSALFVRRAVRAWNRAAVGPLFMAVSRRDADVVIRPAPSGALCDGVTIIQGDRDVAISYGYGIGTSGVVKLGENCPYPQVRTLVAVHELGHILGLNHERRRCSIMSPRLDSRNGVLVRPRVCSVGSWDRLLSHLLVSADVRTARALYREPNRPAEAPPRKSSGSGFGSLWLWAAIVLGGVLLVYAVSRLIRR